MPTVTDQVKAIAKRYGEVEEQLPRSVRYAQREETGEGILMRQAWFNGVGDLLKVTTEKTTREGRELWEFTQTDPHMAQDGLFVFARKEMLAASGVTEVEEMRRYYGGLTYQGRFGPETTNGILIRALRKNARFAPGKPLDTSNVPNVSVAVPKPKESEATEEERKEASKIFYEPEKIAQELRDAGAPESDPFAGVQGDSERFRLIHGSTSPDGRYALAIGFEAPADWSKYADGEVDGQEVFTAEGIDELDNYVVELATKRILGTTGGSYFGTRQRYNHRESTLTWSDDSSIFVQQYDEKWSYVSCHAGRIGAGPKLIGCVDLGEAAEMHAQSYLKRKKRNYQGSIALNVTQVKEDGTILVEVTGQEQSVPNRGDIYFEIEESLRLVEKAGRLELQLMKARLVPAQ